MSRKERWHYLGGYAVLLGIMGLVSAIEWGLTYIPMVGFIGCPSMEHMWTMDYWLPSLIFSTVAALPVVYGSGFCVWSLMVMAMAASRGEYHFSLCFSGWSHGWKMGWLLLFKDLITWLYLLCFIWPGLVRMMEYEMATFVLVEHPKWSAWKCLETSRYLMKGNIKRYLCPDTTSLIILIAFIIIAFIPVVGEVVTYLILPFIIKAISGFYYMLKAEKGIA